MESTPAYIPIVFVLTTLATLLFFGWALMNAAATVTRRVSVLIIIGLLLWLLAQSILARKGIYNTNLDKFPPRILLLGILPALIAIALLFVTRAGRNFVDSLPLKALTWLHLVRIPVEIVLLWLFLHHAVPQLMTFEGRNFDILSGISAPFIAYFGITKNKLKRGTILIWNLICLGLLVNIVVNAFLSLQTPVQQFAFDQPNVAILYFPYSWLPTFVVPVVLLAHLASIRQLTRPARG